MSVVGKRVVGLRVVGKSVVGICVVGVSVVGARVVGVCVFGAGVLGVGVASASHAAVSLSVPAEHDRLPIREYPLLHAGVHKLPLARLAVHAPAAPFVGGADASHASALHTAVSDSVPAAQDRLPASVYPLSHVGVHAAPLARLAVHVPAAPFAGAADASHLGMKVGEGVGAAKRTQHTILLRRTHALVFRTSCGCWRGCPRVARC
jgi:hypothetical protein